MESAWSPGHWPGGKVWWNVERRLISAESVTEGHPDKICDQISDAILDDLLRQDPPSPVAVETPATTGPLLVVGEALQAA